jgi:hypothetical protein
MNICGVYTYPSFLIWLFRFREQLTRDVSFLQAHGIVDYSVLVGIQPLSEERRPSVANFANSIRRYANVVLPRKYMQR